LRIWAGSGGFGAAGLQDDGRIPKTRTVRANLANAAGAVSISSNIAEGKGHCSDGDFSRFLFHARGSLLELQTQIVIAGRLEYLKKDQVVTLTDQTDALGRGLNGLISSVRGNHAA